MAETRVHQRARKALLSRTLVREIIGASSTTPATASGLSCRARDTTAPPIEIASQKMGSDVLAPAASVTASRSLARLCTVRTIEGKSVETHHKQLLG